MHDNNNSNNNSDTYKQQILHAIVGMKDTGLYRVSGLSSEIQKLKMAFNKGSHLDTAMFFRPITKLS